jgi:hypothetical protein
MKKSLFSLLLLCVATFAMAQNNNCAKIKTLISEANKKQLQNEATGDKFHTTDDFDAWMANTKLDGATKCYVQDAHVAKMYVAEFGTSNIIKEADPVLSKKMEAMANMFKTCLVSGFMIRDIKPSDNIFKGYIYEGRGENINTKITMTLIYNPGDKKQLLFVSLINDPD